MYGRNSAPGSACRVETATLPSSRYMERQSQIGVLVESRTGMSTASTTILSNASWLVWGSQEDLTTPRG